LLLLLKEVATCCLGFAYSAKLLLLLPLLNSWPWLLLLVPQLLMLLL
jgi:hypothetical protein